MIGAGGVKKYLFCKRSFYYEYVENYYTDNEYTRKGTEGHKNVHKRQEIHRKNNIKYTSVYLESKELEVNTVVDMIEDVDGKLIPIEFKSGTINKVRFSHVVQLAIEGLLLEKEIKEKVDYGYLYYIDSNRRVKIDFNKELIAKVLNIIGEVNDFLNAPYLPPVGDLHKCPKCSLIEHCMPYETMELDRKIGKLKDRAIVPIDLGEYLYIFKSSVNISVKNGSFFISGNNANLTEKIPINKIKQVILVGNASITTPAVKLLLKNNIPLAITSFNGKYLGSLTPEFSKNSILRFNQYKAHEDKEKTLQVSKAIVLAKLNNMKVFLQRYSRKEEFDFSKQISSISEYIKKSSKSKDIDSLRGYEGIATREYYKGIKEIVSTTGFEFDGRNRRPPKDPVNSMLSYGYTLLYKDLMNACQVVGMDPYIGFMHTDKFGKPSLPLDLMEEFRIPVIDSLVIQLIRKKIITPKDFEINLGNCKFRITARKRYIKHYTDILSHEIKHPLFKYYVTYSRIFVIQARILAKYISGEYK
ncbi:MAG: CRISPR-associated endonuclease Cas1, partial [Candidatus Syntropharchaeia archaeon]